MSAGNSHRGRFLPIEWTLTAMPALHMCHVGKCLVCGEHSTDTADPDEAQLWCLRHAGMTRHPGYEMSAFQFFSARITDPVVGESSLST
ncbi:hypothetical protein ACFQ7F_11835 [Streptomyces sp. NPDC056486]|uniref:DUF7848 domain-containing protein n=1 Tax=Streptomyces sp. NPDC056486 TaxID=3345835 RepID=UPI00368CB44F